MKARVQRWGNSLAVRIPRAFAVQTGLAQDTIVDLSLVDGQITITPAAMPDPSLEDLLAGVTDDNLHTEQDWGEPAGREAW
jgi:antitoxin MazE